MGGKLGFGIIGCGRMGQRRAKTILTNDQAKLICLSDAEDDKSQKLANELGCEHCADPHDILTRPDVDCIVISVPNKFHVSFASAAADAKKHVFCEKPLGRNPEEAREIVQVSVKNSIFLKTGSPFRYIPNVLKAKELLDKSAIGSPLFLRGYIGVPGTHLKGSWISNFELCGGGVFLDMGCHLLDVSRWFFGEVERCRGQLSTMYWPIAPSEDCGMGLFTYEKGRMAFIQASWMEWGGYAYLEIFGTEGNIILDNREPNCLTLLGTKDGFRQIFDYSHLPSQSYSLEMDDFIKSIRAGRQPLASGLDGLRAVQMAHAVYESAHRGKDVLLQGEGTEKVFAQFVGG
jgi:predicted dehydrogenase